MYAGTIARLDRPTDEPLENFFREGGLPALSVDQTQTRVEGDKPPVHTGTAGKRIEKPRQEVSIGKNNDGEPTAIDVSSIPALTDVATQWVADPQDTGIIAAESTEGDGPFDFPFDVLAVATNRTPERLEIDVRDMYEAWESDDKIGSVTMNASDDGFKTTMEYGDEADGSKEPNIGLGFTRPHGGTIHEGVIYESGYVALYSCSSAAEFVAFVRDCVLPFCRAAEDDGTQVTFDE